MASPNEQSGDMSKLIADGMSGSPKPDEGGDRSSPTACSTPSMPNKAEASHSSLTTGIEDTLKTNGTASLDISHGEHGECSSDTQIGNMKKDDSGISIEKSPVKEKSRTGSANLDCDDGIIDGASFYEGEIVQGDSDRPSISNESEGLVADIDTEDSETAVRYSLAPEEMTVGRSENDSDSSTDEDNIDVESGVAEDELGLARKRRERERGSSSSSSSSSSTSGPDINFADSDDDETAGDDESTESTLKDSWHPLFLIRNREFGSGNRMYVSDVFRAKTNASINLVKRLKRHRKLEHHDGCVNALHFNQTGKTIIQLLPEYGLAKRQFFNNSVL